MGVTATTRLPAGWYPDPDGGARRRWWDGQEWTQYTAEFQRPTSVDELVLEPVAEPQKGRKRKPRATKAVESSKPAKVAGKTKTTADAAAAADAEPSRVRVSAERLGRWLAGAVHRRPSGKKRRGAHRSGR